MLRRNVDKMISGYNAVKILSVEKTDWLPMVKNVKFLLNINKKYYKKKNFLDIYNRESIDYFFLTI